MPDQWDQFPDAAAWDAFPDAVPQAQPATAADRGRAAMGGVNRFVAGVAGLPVDTIANIADLASAGLGYVESKVTGRAPTTPLLDRSRLWGSSEYIGNQMGKVGLSPELATPEDRSSRYIYAAASAVPAAALMRPTGMAQAARLAGQSAALGTVPQVVSDAGGGPGAQTAATLGASMVNPASLATARGARAAMQPLGEGGRRMIAGAAMRNAATNPARAINELDTAAQYVPGSKPTAGQAAKDPGIANFENRLRALNPAAFSERLSQQNEARQRLLDTVAKGGQPEAIAALEARRAAITDKLRDNAFLQAQNKRVPVDQVVAKIDALIANPENAGASVQSALKAVRKQVDNSDPTTAPMTDARAMYALRKEINRVLEGKYVGADEHVLRYAGGQLKQVRDSIDDAIATVAPSWKEYLTKYAQLSRPIDRAQEMSRIRQSTSLAAPDIQTGREYLSQPKWKNVVGKNAAELSKILTKGQMQKMQQVADDLDRGAAASNSASVRVPGSDTAANLATNGQLSVANIIGRTLGRDVKDLPPALATVTRPLSWVYKLPDEKVRELIVDAMLDPKLAAQLMREGTPQNIQALSESFRKQAELSGIIVADDVSEARRRLGADE